ncbi:MAG TPA: Imm74 family immunity protein [Terracidiphilus sp.]|nr:Imm74 family immunity protein [Terracidiphilus sp.]
MTFSRSGNRITSSEGYSIEFLGREGVRYLEAGKSVYIFTEYLIPSGIGVWVDSIEHWDPPNDKEKISSEERQRILANVEAALLFVGEVAVFGP